ncbi:ribonuclease H-like domain-containing protein [Ferruginibacter sp. HRS2-29]|uniref:ribonuclease H-like domain-containing protein n=1 Tax=Ferruginibacter sp. HRS2-29 TaxID=2487334 RepID=UPI0020CE1133|nr:ribonuclease H-like domain-containing protein [Ferruginibacter sp. HRS2-29]MCP9750869.1 3'-5' exonuclease [Ferruginibacter sp. HRS2-29]
MQQVRTEDVIVIDIETVSEHPDFESMNENWQHLWEEKVARVVPEGTSVGEFYPMRAGVMAEFSKIICISIGYFNKEQQLRMRIKSFYGDDEKKILQDFLATLQKIESINNKWAFAGHNIREFDIPFICRRLVVNNIPLPRYLDFQNMKPWETNIIDTFQYWRFGDYKHYTSLKLLAAALGIPSPKDDIDGSMVGEVYWKEKNIKRIATYCQKDVITTGNIFLRFKNLPLLGEGDIDIVE